MKSLHCATIPSVFGEFGIIWGATEQGPKVIRVLLPGELTAGKVPPQGNGAGPGPQSNPRIRALIRQIQRFLEGTAVEFDLALIDLGGCSEFQKRVLLAEYEIPRGCVSTYGRIAGSLGAPNAARAVGTALARNPFPIIIPCHRAIRSNGELGGFRGGLRMKRALLELEGVKFSTSGRVLSSRFYY